MYLLQYLFLKSGSFLSTIWPFLLLFIKLFKFILNIYHSFAKTRKKDPISLAYSKIYIFLLLHLGFIPYCVFGG